MNGLQSNNQCSLMVHAKFKVLEKIGILGYYVWISEVEEIANEFCCFMKILYY